MSVAAVMAILVMTSQITPTTSFSVSIHSGLQEAARRTKTDTATWKRMTPTALASIKNGQTHSTPGQTKNEVLTKEAQELWDLLLLQQQQEDQHDDRDRLLVVAQTAPSVRVALSEEFGLEPGAFDSSVLISSLHDLGFDLVLDTNTAADLTVCEEGTELLHRLERKWKTNSSDSNSSMEKADAVLPLLTSCCPGWMNLVQKSFPELVPLVSTCKSPHMMYGAVLKTYSRELLGREASQVYLCSVMPCVRKRGESDQLVFTHIDPQDEEKMIREVDNVITTKDLGMLLRKKGLNTAEDVLSLAQGTSMGTYDSPFQQDLDGMDGTGTGAGQLFGATGGVMEAAVRTVYEVLRGSGTQKESLPKLELNEVRGLDGMKEAKITLPNDKELKVAVVNGLGNAKKLCNMIENGEADYDFVEVMACPGGCIGGGGQPRPSVTTAAKAINVNKKPQQDVLEKRLRVVYDLDESLPRRCAHDNPVVQTLYDKLLGGTYGSETAHDVLHVKQVYGGQQDGNDGEKTLPM